MTAIAEKDESPKVRQINPWFALFIGICAGTFAAPFIKLSQQAGIPSPMIAFARMGLAAIILSPLVLGYYRSELSQLTQRDILMTMLGGLLLEIHFLMLIFALENTSILIMLVIINTGPLWVALLERFFLKEQINRYVWLGMFITIFGSAYIAISANNATVVGDGNPLLGATFSMIASIAGSAYITVGRSVRKKVSLFPYIWIVFGFGGIAGLIYTLIQGIPITGHSSDGYFWLLMLTLIPQLIGHSGFNFALGYLRATIISLSGQSLTITASLVAFFLFAEVPTMTDIIGSVVIAFGVMIAIIYRNHSATK